MRKKVSLYIAGQPVDLDEQSFILFNYTLEEMGNPTIVRNSFSQQITLKGTPTNNKIFGSVFRLDRQTSYGSSFTGAYFDATRKTPFVIYNEMNEILESGYLKLDKVSRKGSEVEYGVTLYGGLGSFFFGLMYNEDGSKRTLADLSYVTHGGAKISSFSISPAATSVKEAWEYIKQPASFNPHTYPKLFWNIINFAPAYNGIPDNFDADKAIVRESGSFYNVVKSKTVDGVEYKKKSDASTILMTFSNPHSEWDVCDLRWYLQRPVMSIKSFLEAICDKGNNGGYEVELHPAFFNADNPYYNDSWMTLQMIAADDRNSNDCLNRVLQSSVSPMEILLSFTKIYGLIFLYDSGRKKVSIMPRKAFYESDSEPVDLTGRVNMTGGIEIKPLVADNLIYQFGDKVIGQFADEYKRDYQREYGIQRINTGFEFNEETKVLTKDMLFKDAVEVMQSSKMFTSLGALLGEPLLRTSIFPLPLFEPVTNQLWHLDGEKENPEEFDMLMPFGRYGLDNESHPYGDWLPKVQLHKEDKPEDGSYVLLFYAGMKTAPQYDSQWIYPAQKQYWLTDDHPDMNVLNQGTPCWNLIKTDNEITSLPSFRRNLIGSDGKTIEYSWDWGVPYARAVPDIQGDKTIYELWWKKYLNDLYDDDTKVMKCKVNMSGLVVNQNLMRKFFWYDHSLWRLNKIINHSLTTWDDTECEFIKIQDKSNYLN